MMMSPEHQPREKLQPSCICDRPHTVVFCRVCGWSCNKARAKRLCAAHPKTMYLMDLESCPKCQANTILLVEYPPDNPEE